MNESYLYRGKRADNGEWVKGYLLEDITPARHMSYIIQGGFVPAISMPSEKYIEVIPETVGQCVGLRDKHNTLYFAGDQFKGHNGIFTIEWLQEKCKFVAGNGRFCMKPALWGTKEIVSNIHEGKE